jgi:hypothetical protein
LLHVPFGLPLHELVKQSKLLFPEPHKSFEVYPPFNIFRLGSSFKLEISSSEPGLGLLQLEQEFRLGFIFHTMSF